MSEIDKFFEELPSEDKSSQDIFDDKSKEEQPTDKVEDKGNEEEEGSFKNRRVRRLEDKLQREREMSIALNERLKVLAEQQSYIKEHAGEIDPRLVRAFGTTDEGKELTKLFQDLLKDTAEEAKARTLEEIEERQRSVVEEQGKEEQFIDSQLEALEDAYQVDLTSDSPASKKARKEFLGLIEKLSPKDEEGNIKEYADFDTTFEIYRNNQQKAEPSRAKELAARSMQNSTSSGSNTAPEGPMTFKKAEHMINRMFNS